ncbi:hypothetical protein BDN70DRAFT_939499 [Pholiota conissans]|uniref:Uncharacterized protein n=1 Tax=Pholiota conissans TaxID=109636 RepID=A0A9P6CR04_9AGAR|nr:hypothetical protein BDN70DRAFT_939499 [Pholiota conissans]
MARLLPSSTTEGTTAKASRPVGCPRKNTKKGKDKEKIKIDWDNELSTALINAITNDSNIKQGLYPSPGGFMVSLNSGGKKKPVLQWKLAIVLFKDHPEYSEAFAHTFNCPNGRTASQYCQYHV